MFEKLKEILVEEINVNPDDIVPSAELINDLGINSLELADLVLLCEEQFDIEIDENAARTFVTIQDVVNYLETIVK
ncbi:MAG: acyl carrier protein [Clostridia bacterium]|nr:acyl carrier protein [Clostridia bacterium]